MDVGLPIEGKSNRDHVAFNSFIARWLCGTLWRSVIQLFKRGLRPDFNSEYREFYFKMKGCLQTSDTNMEIP